VKYVIAAFFLWLLAVLHVSAMPYIKVLGVTPDLVLIFACCWAVIRPDEEAFIIVPIAAVLHDLVSSDPIGTSLLTFAPIVPIASVVRIQAIDSSFLPAAAVVAASSLAYGLIYMLVLMLTGSSVEIDYALLRVVLPGIVVNTLFMPIVYLPIRWLSPEKSSVLRGAGRLTSPL
jgi:rod shape-determining protein MreD